MKGIATWSLLVGMCVGTGACQASRPVAAPHPANQAAASASTHSARETGEALTPERIAGDWAFHDACGDRHDVTLTLRPSGRRVTGAWDDGSVIQGSSGLLSARIVGRRLDATLCTGTEDADGNGLQTCPSLDSRGDYFVLRSGRLVWMKEAGSRQTVYVTLDRPDAAVVPATADCDTAG